MAFLAWHLPRFQKFWIRLFKKGDFNWEQRKEQMRQNIGKKLKTASLNSRFTGSKKEVCFDLITFEKLLLLTYEFTHQQPQGSFTSFKKL